MATTQSASRATTQPATGSSWESWLRSLRPPESRLATPVAQRRWLDKVITQIEQRLGAYEDAHTTLVQKWQDSIEHFDTLAAADASTVVAGLVRSAEHLAAGQALLALAQTERQALRSIAARETPAAALDDGELRSILDSAIPDRAALTRALTAHVLDSLCSLALEFEVVQRSMERDPENAQETWSGMQFEIQDVANRLRELPALDDSVPDLDQLNAAIRTCIDPYAKSLDVTFTVDSGISSRRDDTATMVWLLRELLHHLHVAGAGRVSVELVERGGAPVMRVSTPGDALMPSDPPAPWLLRCRIHLRLVGGQISGGRTDDGGTEVVFEAE